MGNPLNRKCADCVYAVPDKGIENLILCHRNVAGNDEQPILGPDFFCGEWRDASGSTFLNNSTRPKSPFPDTSDRYTIAYRQEELPVLYADEEISDTVFLSNPPRYSIRKIRSHT